MIFHPEKLLGYHVPIRLWPIKSLIWIIEPLVWLSQAQDPHRQQPSIICFHVEWIHHMIQLCNAPFWFFSSWGKLYLIQSSNTQAPVELALIEKLYRTRCYSLFGFHYSNKFAWCTYNRPISHSLLHLPMPSLININSDLILFQTLFVVGFHYN